MVILPSPPDRKKNLITWQVITAGPHKTYVYTGLKVKYTKNGNMNKRRYNFFKSIWATDLSEYFSIDK